MKACLTCQKALETEAGFCTDCGGPLQDFDIDLPKRALTKNGWFWATVALAVLSLLMMIALAGDSETDDNETARTQPTAAVATAPPAPSCPSPADQAYFQSVSVESFAIADPATIMAELFSELVENPLLIASQDWQAEVYLQLDRMEIMIDRILELDAPRSAQSVSNLVEDMAENTKDGIALYRTGIANIDLEALEAAPLKFNEATGKMEQITAQVEAFCDS